MKNILLLFISISVFNTHNIIAQISTHVYVNVPVENSAEFERLEIDYWSKIAKKGIDEGKMTGWGLLKTVGIDNVTHVIVNVFESIEQATNSGSVWDPSVIGMDAREISTVDLRKTIAVVNYQTEVQDNYGDESTNFTIFNYANPNNVAAFINENKRCFNLVCSIYQLNCASSIQMLESFVKSAYQLLKPGGRFIGINISPFITEQANFNKTYKYGCACTF